MELTIDGADAIIADFGDKPSQVTKAMVRALNRSINSGRTVMVREIARDTGMKSKDVREALQLQEASLSRPEASLGAGLRRIPLIDFQARGPEPSRGKGRGVSYRLQTRSRVESAFIATMKSGHRGVFVRARDTFMRVQKPTWKVKRQAIRELFGPSLGHVFAKYRPLGIARVQEVFAANFDHELAFAKSQGGAPDVGAD